MNIFLAGTSVATAYGGPAYSVSRLATALAARGHRVGLWTPDGSVAESPFLDGSDVERLGGTPAAALDAFGRTDVLHDNGIWLRHNHALAREAMRRGVPRIVSPRGMLEPWAVRHKRGKKSLAWWLYQRRDLTRATGHHATADIEGGNLEKLGLGVPVHVIPNGVDVPDAAALAQHCACPRDTGDCGLAPSVAVRTDGWDDARDTREHAANDALPPSPTRTALFLGRLYPVKGLPMLIEAWSRVRPAGWTLTIAGPDEAGHRSVVEAAVRKAGLERVVTFTGALEGVAKLRALAQADLFVLPTHSESFGIAIAEALAHGLPVLTTRGTPWPMLPARGCGWWVEPSTDGIAEGLAAATRLECAALDEMGARGRALVQAEYGWDRVADRFLALYDTLMHARGRAKEMRT
jgi:glycosyltransferase involved in cell wall biosynthesis